MESSSPTAENGPTAPLVGTNAVEDFCRSLAAQDEIDAQRHLCAELSRRLPRRAPDSRDLGALLALDRHAALVGERLAVRYAEGDAALRVLDRRALTAALGLCHAFMEAYAHVLRHIELANDEFWRSCTSTVLARLFRHRQLELLLRLFRYKKRNSQQWRELHEEYRFALARGITGERPGSRDGVAPGAGARSLEDEFIRILLLDALNTGQFSPRELWRASQLFARWSPELTLQPAAHTAGALERLPGFIVDLDGAEGLTRPSREATGTLLHLDTSPLMHALDQEVATLRSEADSASAATATRVQDEPLLARLRVALAPAPVHVVRRGERTPVDETVLVVIGIAPTVHMLRLAASRTTEEWTGAGASLDGITLSLDETRSRVSVAPGSDPLGGLVNATGAVPQPWQVKDRSDSGCRMRGRTHDLNGVIPGSLVAFAASDRARWTVAVVRRLRRLMVDHVEISVEYIGRHPRFVKIATDAPPAADVPSVQTARCYGALFLPASEEHPRMPIRTLLVPACVFAPGAVVTLMSSRANYALQFNKALRQHADFVWTSFSVIANGPAMAPWAAAE